MPTKSVCLIGSNGKRLETTAEGHAVNVTTGTNGAADAVVIATLTNLARWDAMLLRVTSDALLDNGAHNATADLVLQRTFDGGTTWEDFLYIGQIANLTAFNAVCWLNGVDSTAFYGADKGDVTENRADCSVTPFTITLSAGERRWGHWGERLRLVAKRLANTTAGSVVTIDITAWNFDE